jgi:FkbM family methyltransferase
MKQKLKFESIGEHTVIAGILDSKSVIVDLGAHKGGFSLALQRKTGCRCYLFEANAQLCKMLPTNEFIRTMHCAVSDHDGFVCFHIAENPEASSVLNLPQTSTIGSTLTKTETVPCRRLGGLLAEVSPFGVDILKVDIEGAEIAALGSLQDADLVKIAQITIEFHSHPMFGFDLARETEGLLQRFRSLGFSMFDFSRSNRRDVLLLNRRLLGLSNLRILLLKYRHDFIPFAYREARYKIACRTRFRHLLSFFRGR